MIGIMRIFSIFVFLVLSNCTAMVEANYSNVFKVAYGQEAEETGPETYSVSFTFLVFPSADRAQERESIFAGMLGALARKGESLGYVSMQTHSCTGRRHRAGGSHFVSGECSAKMFKEELETSAEVHLIREAIERAEKRKAYLEKL